jgi:hypothetical protein
VDSVNLSKSVKVTRVMNAVAAGTSEQTSSALDMAGFESVEFLVSFGTITAGAVTSIKIQQSDDDGVADAYSDLLGSSLSIADTGSNKMLVYDLVKPMKRYIKILVERGTANAVIDGIVALQYGPRHMPVVHSTTVAGSELNISPAEGTA